MSDQISVRKFALADLGKFSPRAEEKRILELPAFQDCLSATVQVGGAFTAWLGGEVFVIYMHTVLWTGAAEVGILASTMVSRKKKLFVKTTRTFLRIFEANFPELKRIQAMGLADDPHDLFFEACGFEMECERLRHFFPNGADARLWARIR